MIVRVAEDGDVDAIAALHADSWRRHYRGAYADAYLDGDLDVERRAVWRARFQDRTGTVTIVAEDEQGLIGFVHVVLDDDGHWGSLVDNLHVTSGRRHGGVGTALHTAAVGAVLRQATSPHLYLWVLEQNTAAQRFYRSRGGVHAGTVPVGGDPRRLHGSPNKFRMVWRPVQMS
ncbi:GNAT family N-acetyltransferase [Dactylosporangium sp. NPDC049525]|uniref:GNAT family N-acetyltransferase n=1 Tax=Dactylosporangium sp. NPDC049525 TaxID=3154730 RepID=UPI0034268DB6